MWKEHELTFVTDEHFYKEIEPGTDDLDDPLAKMIGEVVIALSYKARSIGDLTDRIRPHFDEAVRRAVADMVPAPSDD